MGREERIGGVRECGEGAGTSWRRSGAVWGKIKFPGLKNFQLGILRYKKCHLGFGVLGLGLISICLVGLLHLLGRQMSTKDAADLCFRPNNDVGIIVGQLAT